MINAEAAVIGAYPLDQGPSRECVRMTADRRTRRRAPKVLRSYAMLTPRLHEAGMTGLCARSGRDTSEQRRTEVCDEVARAQKSCPCEEPDGRRRMRGASHAASGSNRSGHERLTMRQKANQMAKVTSIEAKRVECECCAKPIQRRFQTGACANRKGRGGQW